MDLASWLIVGHHPTQLIRDDLADTCWRGRAARTPRSLESSRMRPVNDGEDDWVVV